MRPSGKSIDELIRPETAASDRRTLIRRATFDLIGLPPGPEEVSGFINDPDPRAYEKLIDRLLASPHYGERWGRLWLDVARYADTGGYETDVLFPNAWRYRDYRGARAKRKAGHGALPWQERQLSAKTLRTRSSSR
ncbi:MAG: DUF1549 domain-containing protein [Bryobacteraceae bacterium]